MKKRGDALLAFLILTMVIAAAAGCTNSMRMSNCKEIFAEIYVPASDARQNVPPGYEVRIYPNGQAMLLFMVQDCEKCVLNHIVRVSPMRMAHAWIEITGPEETGAVLEGTTGSLPTQYYYVLPHQMDSALARFGFWVAGIDAQKVERISLGGDFTGTRRGMVVENESPLVKYEWEESGALRSSTETVTGRRQFYREYGGLVKLKSEGLAECRSIFLGDAEVEFTADTESALGSLNFGSILDGKSNPVHIVDCNVSIKVGGR